MKTKIINKIQELTGREECHLEHVLQALHDACVGERDFKGELIDNKFIRIYGDGEIEGETSTYDFTGYDLAKPFTSQSPELYKFLSDILIKE